MIKSVLEYLENSASAYPQKTAFEDADSAVTFEELYQKARGLAGKINALTNGMTNSPVAVYLPKNADCIISFMAAAYSGNFYTPLDVSMPRSRLEKILSVLKPAVVLTNSNGISLFNEIFPAAILINISRADEPPENRDALRGVFSNAIDTDPLYVMFTSGSTGVPKGVVISHRSVIDYTEWLAETFSFSADTVFGSQAPFYFDNSILDIYSTLRNGAKTIIIPEEKFLSPPNLCKYIDEKHINTIFWVPSALVLTANSKALEKHAPKGLQKILFCGEVMPAKQLNIWQKHLPEALYANLYGPTEITDVCAYYIIDRKFNDDDPLPIGFPCNNTAVLTLDDDNKLIPQNETGRIGELCIKGTCLSAGYYNDPDKTEKAFVQNPLNASYPEKIYRTGDLVQYNERGELMFSGRKDYQIKHMGNRIELGEIETAASSFNSVARCCALYSDVRKKIILAASPESIDKTALYSYLKTLLPQYMLPAQIETLDDMPLNQNGKIDRILLRNKYC